MSILLEIMTQIDKVRGIRVNTMYIEKGTILKGASQSSARPIPLILKRSVLTVHKQKATNLLKVLVCL